MDSTVIYLTVIYLTVMRENSLGQKNHIGDCLLLMICCCCGMELLYGVVMHTCDEQEVIVRGL